MRSGEAGGGPRPVAAVWAWLCVGATFALIFLGGMVTTKGAGLAVPDWPLSFGALNPHGWWRVEPVALEHGHRLVASVIGLLTAVLAAVVWRNAYAIPVAALVSVASVVAGRLAGLDKAIVMHLAIWPPALAFVLTLLHLRRGRPGAPEWLAMIAFVGVCVQATLGGLRVTELSIVLAMIHGCVAQAFLLNLLAIAMLLSPGWHGAARGRVSGLAGIRKLAVGLVVAVYAQLILGAVMRHSGAGLAIADFPKSLGRWVPEIANFAVGIHFAHRVGALVVTLVALALVIAIVRGGRGDRRLMLGAAALVGLIAFQISLGAHIIWLMRPPVTTTLHVVVGAAVLSFAMGIAMRSFRLRESMPGVEALRETAGVGR